MFSSWSVYVLKLLQIVPYVNGRRRSQMDDRRFIPSSDTLTSRIHSGLRAIRRGCPMGRPVWKSISVCQRSLPEARSLGSGPMNRIRIGPNAQADRMFGPAISTATLPEATSTDSKRFASPGIPKRPGSAVGSIPPRRRGMRAPHGSSRRTRTGRRASDPRRSESVAPSLLPDPQPRLSRRRLPQPGLSAHSLSLFW